MSAKLVYFEGRGRAEIIRIILAVAGVEFTEVNITDKKQWEDMKRDGTLLFEQVPMLEIDGLNLVQTGAIVRYLARKCNLYGNNNKDSTIIDTYYEETREFYHNTFITMGFVDEAEVLKKTTDQFLPKYLPIYEKVLESSDGKYLVGDTLSLADLSLLEVLLAIEEYMGMDALEVYPNLKEYYQDLKSFNKIASFLSGPHRKKRNDESYVSNITKIFPFAGQWSYDSLTRILSPCFD